MSDYPDWMPRNAELERELELSYSDAEANCRVALAGARAAVQEVLRLAQTELDEEFIYAIRNGRLEAILHVMGIGEVKDE